MSRWFIAVFIYAFALPLAAQVTNIGGVINSSSEVTSISYVNNYVVVANGSLFAVDEETVLIQMKGVTINESNTSSFGSISNYNDAGNYEIATICEINGDTIIFTELLLKTYTPGDGVQLVTFPNYVAVNVISSTLLSPEWDGTTGGVLALSVDSIMILNTNVYVRKRGFLGGVATNGPFGCSWANIQSDYYYEYSGGRGAAKGEGVAYAPTNKDGGKGPLANGGGGSNDHNGGGGGGGNKGSGGAGGQRIPKGFFYCKCTSPGLGGLLLNYNNTDNKVFMGGGGGAGHGNNDANTVGGDGGGLAIIRANTIHGKGYSILAEGQNAALSGADGAGGGGAGGTVLLEVDSFTSSTLNIEVDGGKGGSTNNSNGEQCCGPGGGGGGGALWIKGSSLPANVVDTYTGGVAGTTTNTTQSNCTIGGTNSAAAGSNGALVTGLVIPQGATPFGSCGTALPVLGLELSGKFVYGKALLKWSTLTEIDNDFFTLERSVGGAAFVSITKVDGAGTSYSSQTYYYTDTDPALGVNYYRLRQTDFNGQFSYSNTLAILVRATGFELSSIYPNPTVDHLHARFKIDTDERLTFQVLDIHGRLQLSLQLAAKAGLNEAALDLSQLPQGAYFLRIVGQQGVLSARFVKQ